MELDDSAWTAKKNKLFENALAIFDRETPERWQNIADAVGGISVEEAKKRYEILRRDIELIEADKYPPPTNASLVISIPRKELRLKHPKL